MTTLGQAYVQIMPSAKGISGSIQKTLNPEATLAGKSAGSRIASSIADSMGKVGKTLTKSITVPALGAATAIGGLVGALGFKRLVGMDVAQAKLKGLGIEGKQLEIVMENAKDAVTGTTHTMAEGADVAAGALAAGVKEGADLERYIKLVGDAATGANAPMGEMAQIFNRVQGTGKLTRHELNQIEHRLPGFSQSMMKHVGADSLEAFYDMVTAGKVGSDEFLDVMDDFAGGMSAAYAETWSGLKDNVLANIGIIGEALLEGLFEDGKKGMAEFLDFLRNSDGLKEWAAETGEKLRLAFNKIIEVIKNVIKWWTGLSDGAKTFIGIIAGVAVAIGPILMIISKLIGAVISAHKWFGLLKVAAGIIGSAIGAISAPVWIVIGVITGLIALFVTLYKKNETFRELVHTVWESIKEVIGNVIQAVSDFVMEIWGQLVAWWQENGQMILQAAQNVWDAIKEKIGIAIEAISSFIKDIFGQVVEWWKENQDSIGEATSNVWEWIQGFLSGAFDVIVAIFKFVWPLIEFIIVDTWNAIKNVIQGAIDVITGIIDFFAALFTGDWEGLWEAVKKILSGAVQLLWGLVNLWFVGKILKIGKSFIKLFKGIFSKGWNLIKDIFTRSVTAVRNFVSTGFNAIRTRISAIMNGIRTTLSNIWNGIRNVISGVLNGIRSVVSSVWNGIKNVISNVVNSIRNTIRNIFNSLRSIVSSAFNGVRSAVSNGMRNAFNAVKNFFGRFKDAGKNIVTSIADGIKGAIGKVTGAIGDVASKIRNFLPFSPPKEGPLMDIMDVKWGETIGGGIEKGKNEVAKAMDKLLEMPRISLENTSDSVYDFITLDGLRESATVKDAHTINNENHITVHAVIREEQDINKLVRILDEKLNDLSIARNRAFGR